MAKRSNFDRIPRDFYPTPEAAVLPLLPHLQPNTRFAEPCCGNMALADHLEKHGHSCYWASDIEERSTRQMAVIDALELTMPIINAGMVICNTPWDRKILHPMIDHFRNLAPSWLLFDAGWAYTRQSSELMKYCKKIVAVGRVKWIPDSKMSGKDDCAWYYFVKDETVTQFIGRQ